MAPNSARSLTAPSLAACKFVRNFGILFPAQSMPKLTQASAARPAIRLVQSVCDAVLKFINQSSILPSRINYAKSLVWIIWIGNQKAFDRNDSTGVKYHA
jgi:hypothetical protein